MPKLGGVPRPSVRSPVQLSAQTLCLAPSLAGLYQINVQVPTSGLGSGDNVYVEFITDAADVNQIQIPYGSAGSGRAVTGARPPAKRIRRLRAQDQKPMKHRLRRGA